MHNVSKCVSMCDGCDCDLEVCGYEARHWFSGKISRCHRDAPGSIPGWRIPFASSFFGPFFLLVGFHQPSSRHSLTLIFPYFFTIFSILLFFFNVDTVRERLASMRQTFQQPVKYCGHAQVDSSSVLYRLIADGHARNTARQHNLHLLRGQTFVFI